MHRPHVRCGSCLHGSRERIVVREVERLVVDVRAQVGGRLAVSAANEAEGTDFHGRDERDVNDHLRVVVVALHKARAIEPLVERLEDVAARVLRRCGVERGDALHVYVGQQIVRRPIVDVAVQLTALAAERAGVRHARTTAEFAVYG